MNSRRKHKDTCRIEDILRSRGSPLVEEVSKVPNVKYLSRALREKIVDELGDEFYLKGRRANGEPNEYGLELEKLTDACGLAWD